MTTEPRFPFWFKAAVAFGFGCLFTAYGLAQDPARLRLFASPLAAIAPEQLEPLLGVPAPLAPFAPEPPTGAYRINGMIVEYATLPLAEPLEQVFARFGVGFEEAGYTHKTTTIRGAPTIVALHPESKMLLIVRAELGPEGTRSVRLSQQNLSQWQTETRREIPGLPAYPGAHDPVLIEYLDGRDVKTLTYTVAGEPEAAAEFYAGMLRRGRWTEEESPLQSISPRLPMHFFRGPDGECSVVAAPTPAGSGALVMVTLDRGERSRGDG